MKTFLVYVRDEDYYQFLPEELGGSKPGDKRVKVMAFPPLGIETLAPVVRQHGHEVRMFDTCHPEMKGEHIAQAAREERPDVIALSFLSTTTYAVTKVMAERLKSAAPDIPIILGGVFASMNATHILKDCPYADCIGVGEGEELIPDYLDNMNDPGSVAGLVWRDGDRVVSNPPARLSRAWISFHTRTGTACQLIISSHCLLTFPLCSLWTNSAQFRLREAALTAAPTAIFLLCQMANGATARPSMCWERCKSSTMRATAQSISRMIIFCSNASASTIFAAALLNAVSSSAGAVKEGSIQLPSTNCLS